MHHYRFEKIGIIFYFIIVTLVSFIGTAFAQTSPSSIQKAVVETDRPVREKAAERMRKRPDEKPVIEREKDLGAPEGLKYLIKDIVIEGAETFPVEDFNKIVEKYK